MISWGIIEWGNVSPFVMQTRNTGLGGAMSCNGSMESSVKTMLTEPKGSTVIEARDFW